MDFIERLFGFSPDGGDGTTELLWLGVLALAIAVVVYFRIQRRKAQQISSAGRDDRR
ncbi:MAG TPA: LPXTG cell wall anchor domain-containing protein [Vineibacter sp.]|nr:LPXTG cell wall anchor domain-containing protein [Vineibacter sp.]